MKIEELLEKYNFISLEDHRIKVDTKVTEEEMKSFVEQYCDFHKENREENYLLDLKGLNRDVLACAMRYFLTKEDFCDKLVILNLINLIKTCNTLDDEVFKDKDIYVNSLTEFLDLKLLLKEELKEFCTKLSIYYVSLFKSYAKLEISFLDDARDMPELYGMIVASLDFFTLGGIFSKANTFDTKDCFVIKNAASYVVCLSEKNQVSNSLLEMILKDKKE